MSQWRGICLPCRSLEFGLGGGTIPWKRKWQPTPVFLPGESHGQRSHGMQSMGSQESDTTEWLNNSNKQEVMQTLPTQWKKKLLLEISCCIPVFGYSCDKYTLGCLYAATQNYDPLKSNITKHFQKILWLKFGICLLQSAKSHLKFDHDFWHMQWFLFLFFYKLRETENFLV